ncbi:MAG: aldehyde ferredoxin oxidoreductase [Nanoarchaeota archaeon]|nr:aldehyde ferredoxin oxidoreductase [Nanoarchaeota archaeon]
MLNQKALRIDAGTGKFSVDEVRDEKILGPVDFSVYEIQRQKDAFCFGSGPLAGSIIPGTKRMIFCGFSPLWESFYISTMGGAADVFHATGLNYVSITGSRDNHSVMKLNSQSGKIKVDFVDVDPEPIWNDYNGQKGTYALQQYCYDNYGKEFKRCRILATGPAAMKTKAGAILSAPIVNDGISPVDCWAGRGGLGSKLLQDHKIVAVIYGGDFEDADEMTHDKDEINRLFQEKYQKIMIAETVSTTKKYRFDPELGTGGTFGVNFLKLGSWMFSFNYSSIYFPDEKRKQIHEEFILKHYHKQFNEETIDKKQFKQCGENCPVVCKKMNNEFKKDYEPYESMGPNSGVFDQRGAEKLNRQADTMGFDAIQIGSVISWIMELLVKGMIKKEDFGLTKDPKFDADNFDVVNDSMHNAELGVEIIDMILFSDKGAVFRDGIREAAKQLDKKLGIKSINLAAFIPHNKHGCMVPNQYWTPGMFSPMPIMGKYFEYYGAGFFPPRELGRKNVERMAKELYMDNTGMCRFHRGWAEEIIEKIVNDLFKMDLNYFEHHKRLARMINMGNKAVFWESERVIDLIKGYLEKMHAEDKENAELNSWVEKFSKDKMAAAKEYWDELLAGINEGMA